MDPTKPLIPTRYKAKIPATVSWTLGAQEISDALANVPQFRELRITFSFHMMNKTALKHWPWMEVLRCSYNKSSNSLSMSKNMIERGRLERQWSISVRAVPRAERKRFHDLLLLELPKAAAWFLEHQARQAMGQLDFVIIWDKQKDTLYTSTEVSAEAELAD
jgi:hypothetical protein